MWYCVEFYNGISLQRYAVAQSVETMGHTLEVAGSIPFRPHYGPGVDPASKCNEDQGYLQWGKSGRCLRLTTLPPSRADCLEILGAMYRLLICL
jgi:hypothetical protein